MGRSKTQLWDPVQQSDGTALGSQVAIGLEEVLPASICISRGDGREIKLEPNAPRPSSDHRKLYTRGRRVDQAPARGAHKDPATLWFGACAPGQPSEYYMRK